MTVVDACRVRDRKVQKHKAVGPIAQELNGVGVQVDVIFRVQSCGEPLSFLDAEVISDIDINVGGCGVQPHAEELLDRRRDVLKDSVRA